MARIETAGLDSLMNNLRRFSLDVSEDLTFEMLEAGAKVTVEDWKQGIEAHGHVDTGRMKKSVKASKKGKNAREIYPRGKDRKGVRNAEKAFILHYGNSNKQGDRFIDDIEDKAYSDSLDAMEEVYNDYLFERGLI